MSSLFSSQWIAVSFLPHTGCFWLFPHIFFKSRTIPCIPQANTAAAAAPEFPQRRISWCHRSVYPWPGTRENGGTLSLHISWSVKTVSLPASTRYFTTGIFHWCQRDPKATNCLWKKKLKIKYEWKWCSQRQNKLLYFATVLRLMQGNTCHAFRSPVRGLREEPCRDCSSVLVQPPGKTWQEAGRDPKHRLNCSLAFLLAAISASEDTSYQVLS